MKPLVIVSRNPGKVSEIRLALEHLREWDVRGLPDTEPDMEETGSTFLENATQKATFYGSRLGGWTVADDSGLEVSALGGRPGIYSARYAPDDTHRNRKLLDEMKTIPDQDRQAEFVCALVLACDGRVEWQVEERVRGSIARLQKGRNGFGFDPLFLLPDLGVTMAELDPADKNRISHRGRALARLAGHLSKGLLSVPS